MGSHSYIPMTKPASLTVEEWLQVVAEFGQRYAENPYSDQPPERPHWGIYDDGNVIFIEALWQSAKVAIPEVTEQLVAEIVSEMFPKYDLRTIQDELTDKVIALEPNKDVSASREAALNYIETKKSEWEPPKGDSKGDGKDETGEVIPKGKLK